jgi:hypothetical protein
LLGEYGLSLPVENAAALTRTCQAYRRTVETFRSVVERLNEGTLRRIEAETSKQSHISCVMEETQHGIQVVNDRVDSLNETMNEELQRNCLQTISYMSRMNRYLWTASISQKTTLNIILTAVRT